APTTADSPAIVNSARPSRTTNISWPRSWVWPWLTSPGSKRIMRDRISGVMKRLRMSVRASKTSSAMRVRLLMLEVRSHNVTHQLNVSYRFTSWRNRRLARSDALPEVLQFELERIVVPRVLASPRCAIGVHSVQDHVRWQSAREPRWERNQ